MTREREKGVNNINPSLPVLGDATTALEDLENTVREFMKANPSIDTFKQVTDILKVEEFRRKYRNAMNLFWETIGILDTIRVPGGQLISVQKGAYTLTDKSHVTVRANGCEFKLYKDSAIFSMIVKQPENWLPSPPPCLSEPDDKSVRSEVEPDEDMSYSATAKLVPGHDDWQHPENIQVEIRCFHHTRFAPINEFRMPIYKYTSNLNKLPEKFGLRKGWTGQMVFDKIEGERLCNNVHLIMTRLYKQLKRSISVVPKDMTNTKRFFETSIPSRENIRKFFMSSDLGLCNWVICMKETSKNIAHKYTDNIFVVAQGDVGGFVIRMFHRWVLEDNPTDFNSGTKFDHFRIYKPEGSASKYVDGAMRLLDKPRVISILEGSVTHRYDSNFLVHICSYQGKDFGEVYGSEPESQCHRLIELYMSTQTP